VVVEALMLSRQLLRMLPLNKLKRLQLPPLPLLLNKPPLPLLLKKPPLPLPQKPLKNKLAH
jgi:hypothetical protein